jgi:hypothetical protein
MCNVLEKCNIYAYAKKYVDSFGNYRQKMSNLLDDLP